VATTCQFERKLGNVGKTLARAKREAAKFGSVFEGDEAAGHYRLRTPLGSVIGTYTVESSVCRFDVEKKPRVVPRALIERVFDEFMGWGDPDERWSE